ncbi:hypothetical protein [Pseudalkalibacillus caeni]|uniref:Uncharacterized protein n=1 Tax=Exobacillus caeni TaxID=2574798 RepID=A0A5R9F724_9BACL|nr:hypothetical protein [Pseudalkalibacillus caeni]TLS38841.1 hypothetical protein FCL54_00550 [Pseudalkalibacillus caeni]
MKTLLSTLAAVLLAAIPSTASLETHTMADNTYNGAAKSTKVSSHYKQDMEKGVFKSDGNLFMESERLTASFSFVASDPSISYENVEFKILLPENVSFKKVKTGIPESISAHQRLEKDSISITIPSMNKNTQINLKSMVDLDLIKDDMIIFPVEVKINGKVMEKHYISTVMPLDDMIAN